MVNSVPCDLRPRAKHLAQNHENIPSRKHCATELNQSLRSGNIILNPRIRDTRTCPKYKRHTGWPMCSHHRASRVLPSYNSTVPRISVNIWYLQLGSISAFGSLTSMFRIFHFLQTLYCTAFSSYQTHIVSPYPVLGLLQERRCRRRAHLPQYIPYCLYLAVRLYILNTSIVCIHRLCPLFVAGTC